MTFDPASKELLTAREVAHRLSIGVRTLYSMVRRGEFPKPIRPGKRLVRWKAADVQRYIDSLRPDG
ncbi:MAG TPA: helix-turn-helix domain-containing protein [Gemmataceae bacterium]|nr:helix-turn-helix domain-containing protein [Gemmataceae bacterium]